MLPQSPLKPTQIHNEPMTTSELAIELDDQPLANSEPDAFVFLERPEISPKNIFPMLHNMVRHGTLNVPVIGLAKSGWSIDQFWNRARLFVRERCVEGSWAVVQQPLGNVTPTHVYEPGSWGPTEADRLATDIGGWHDLQ